MAEDHEDDGDDDGGQDEQDDGSSHGFIIADNLERANADIAARQAVMPQQIPLF